uniref:Reverse transcriptase domain-containing protein n=2 Tax=Nicotiana TaxID=4085 RepID=A0A1S3ZL95_TOBAC|nr:PREDICTED: uncharacterized protein LOC104215309 [Nicotiana sylvestris]XP_016465127.1 PREDICTED: uncharacterized protein LOC107788003 [Nicotiana tabacum]
MKTFLQKHKISLIAIVEHIVQTNKEKEITNKCAPGWSWCSDSSTNEKGRIWILWDTNSIQFTLIRKHAQYIHGSKQIPFIAIYGLHTIAHRCDMWEALRRIDSQLTNSWIIMGDFNAIRDIEDRVNGIVVQENEIKDFRSLMEDCRLNELGTVGRSYTWTNSHVYSRIDRAIVNAHWMINMPPMQVHVMDPQFSNHSPLCIELERELEHKGRPFKFFNCLAEHPDFDSIIRDRWNKENRKRNTKKQLEKWSTIEEGIYRQRSRIQWLQLGDSNTAFFFASMKRRATQNQIKFLHDDKGRLINKPEDIEQEIVGFYKGLLGSSTNSIPAINPSIMRKGPGLTRSQQLQLIALFINEDVMKALQEIGDSKAPSGDGFNAYFYKKTWHIIGKDITKAVLEFFNEGLMYKPVNSTTVTLIPKVKTPSSVKQFRPISCCTIIYKIISKMLTSRLQTVMESLVDMSQAAFVPGRILSDNILLGHELVKGYGRKGVSPRCMVKIDMQKASDSIEWNFLE